LLSEDAEDEPSTTTNGPGTLDSATDAENEPAILPFASTPNSGYFTAASVSSTTTTTTRTTSRPSVIDDRVSATNVHAEIGSMLVVWTVFVLAFDVRGALAAYAASLARVFLAGKFLQIAVTLCTLTASTLVTYELGTVIAQAAITFLGALAVGAHRLLFRKPCDASGRAAASETSSQSGHAGT